MCGLTGFIDLTRRLTAPNTTLTRMTNAIAHRGPDDEGGWFDPESAIGLGHRRLAILDLSPEGHQPMFSPSGRYAMVYNGEIYNFADLRRDLAKAGFSFRGHSDTEVMLAAFEHWGLEASVKRFIGMFACALWDRREQRLHLIRDRLGIKPLYYGVNKGVFLFGSELKALRACDDFRAEIDRGALSLYMRHNYVPVPYTIYWGIRQLPPGTILSFAPNRDNPDECRPRAYWSAKALAEVGIREPWRGTPTEAIDELDQRLRDAVSLRMIADVPLGALLSGGVDSSTVVALMQAQSARPVKTFSIGFREQGYDEAGYARAVARALGTEHTELYVESADAQAVIPRLPTLYDEPFADSSQIPTFLVCELARRHVTVALSGDGGDELFCGYTRYQWGRRIWRLLGSVPRPLRLLLSHALTAVAPQQWDRLFAVVRARLPQPGLKAHKFADTLALSSPDALYRQLVSHWKEPAAVVKGGFEPPTALTDTTRQAQLPDFLQRMMFFDLMSYLPDDILVKVDRASMGVALEARVPLIDHRVVEFALRLPLNLKLRDGQSKWLLRQVLYRYVPKELIERPKMGFAIPLADWLKGPLRDWAETYLAEARLNDYFHPQPIRELWRAHLAGERDYSAYLWDVLMFETWREAHP